jgi:hypothetical protein
MSALSAERTLGSSPKVIWPTLGGGALGAGLLLLGGLRASRSLRDAGAGAIGATAVSAALGYVAPPGPVFPPDHDVSEMHEAEHATPGMPETATAAEPAIASERTGD